MPNTSKVVEIDQVREKLIELLRPWLAHNSLTVADDLIANGVTFGEDNNDGHKWIPVTERLPEVVDTYLVVVKAKYDYEDQYEIDVDVATYNPHEKAYIDGCWDTYNDWDEGQQYLHVTHWMPLPQPPKGE